MDSSLLSAAQLDAKLHSLESLSVSQLGVVAASLEALITSKGLHPPSFPVLVKTLQLLNLIPRIKYPISAKSSENMSGSECKTRLLDHVIGVQWEPGAVVALVSALGEIGVSASHCEVIVHKGVSAVPNVDLTSLPPLTYQLLLLSKWGCKKLIIKGLCDALNNLLQSAAAGETRHSPEVLSHTLATIIVHMSFALKQDPDLQAALIKLAKFQLNEFIVWVLLSSSLSSFSSTVSTASSDSVDFIKSSIVTHFKTLHKIKDTAFKDTYDFNVVDLKKIVQRVVSRNPGAEAVRLGVVLIDGATSGFGRSLKPTKLNSLTGGTGNSEGLKDKLPKSPIDESAELGVWILREMFRNNNHVRSFIMDEILSRIISRAGNLSYWCQVLETVGRGHKISNILDYLPHLAPTHAQQVLRSLGKAISSDLGMRDQLMIALRKGIVCRDLEARRISVIGYLTLLEPQEQTAGSSSSRGGDTQQALYFEILNTLRRCFAQQPEIKLTFYEGLYNLLSIRPEILPLVFEIFRSQVVKHFRPVNTGEVVLELELCVDNSGQPRVLEPLQHLLKIYCHATTLILKSADSPAASSTTFKEGLSHLRKLVHMMTKSEMEEFDLDKNSDFTVNNPNGIRNNIYASLILGVYEVLVEFAFYLDDIEAVHSLFSRFWKLWNVVKEKSVNSKGRKTVGSISDISLLRLSVISDMITRLFSTDSASSVKLRTDKDFVKYIFTIMHSHISKLQSDPASHDLNTYNICAKLANNLFVHFVYPRGNAVPTQERKKEKGKAFDSAVTECFTNVFRIISEFYPDKVMPTFHTILEHLTDDAIGVKDSHITKFLSKTVKAFVVSFLEEKSYKDACAMMSFLAMAKPHFEDAVIVDWVIKICMDTSIDDPGFVKILMAILLDALPWDGMLPIIEDARDVWGDWSNEEKRGAGNDIVTERTAGTIVNAVVGRVEKVIDDMDWVLTHAKNEVQSMELDLEALEDRLSGLESRVCTELISIAHILVVVLKTMLKDTSWEHVLKVMPKFYKVLSQVVKLQLLHPVALNIHFLNMIQLVCDELTKHLYLTINHIQSKDQDEAMGEDGRGKKAKGRGKITQSKILKESKAVPNLVYMVEQYEKFLIQLSKKSQSNLMKFVKRSTARDFKIHLDKIRDIVSDDDDEEDDIKKQKAMKKRVAEDGDIDEEEEDDEENEEPNKRRKA